MTLPHEQTNNEKKNNSKIPTAEQISNTTVLHNGVPTTDGDSLNALMELTVSATDNSDNDNGEKTQL